MKKINLFLWGIVSTCITFFYRTEICAADVSFYIYSSKIKTSNCSAYDDDIFNVKTTLRNKVSSKSLCVAGTVFIGCSGPGDVKYELSEYGLDALAKYCLQKNYGGMCRNGAEACPTPGTEQDSTEATFIYLDTCHAVCSGHYVVKIHEDGEFTHGIEFDDDNKPILYIQTICLQQPRDHSAFGHVNSRSNTCAINAGGRFEDDTGWYSYTEKCYYTE